MLVLGILLNIFNLVLGLEITGVQHYIINGTYVKPGEYASFVSIYYNTVHNCGGSLISLKQVLTAAHCLVKFGYSPEVQISLLAGGTHRQIIEYSRQIRYTRNVVIHPFHRPSSSAFDIATLFVDPPFLETFYVRPIPMALKRPSLGDKCKVLGYGYTEHRNPNSTSKFLRVTTVDILEARHCFFSPFESTYTICAGDLEGNRDSSLGDSGGPLIHKGQLVGIVSTGTNNPFGPVYYGSYVDVSAHLDWIESPSNAYASAMSNFDSSMEATTLLILFLSEAILFFNVN